MTTSKNPKKSKHAAKPLHIEIHGDGIDVVATFQGSTGDSKGRDKTKDSGWEKLFQLLSNVKMTSSSSAVPDTDGQNLGIEDAVFLIRSATPEDLEIILAAIRARAVYDAQDAAAQPTAESAADTTS